MNTKKENNGNTSPLISTVLLLVFILIDVVISANSYAEEGATNKTQRERKAEYIKFFDQRTHWSDALVITCSDFRFTTATQTFINESLGLQGNYDYISIPGSIRNLIDKKTRDIVLNTFGVSVRLHHVKRIIIVGHQGCICGYGGGTKSFSDPAVECNAVSNELRQARKLISKKYPHLTIHLYYGTVLYKGQQCIYNFNQIL